MIAAPSLPLGSLQFLAAGALSRPLAAQFHQPPRIHRRRPIASQYSAAPASSAPAPTPSLYDVLGVPAGAALPEIKTAYRRLARACHPDATAAGGGGSASADEFMRVHAAYATLCDPEKRADYDRKLFVTRRRSPFSSPTPSPAPFCTGHSRRTWETDQCW